MSYTLRAMPEEHINNYAQATASNLFEFFFFITKKNNIYVSVQRVVCCSHQSDGLGYVSRTNQIAALGYVSRTNQIAALGHVSRTNQSVVRRFCSLV